MKKTIVLVISLLFHSLVFGIDYIIPHLTAENASWGSVVQADNLSSSPQSFTITLFRDGTQVFFQEYNADSMDKLLVNLSQEASEGVCGFLSCESPDVVFRLSYESYIGRGLAEFALTPDTANTLVFLFSDFSTSVEWKGIAIANISEQPVPGILYAIGQGRVLGSTALEVPALTRIRGVHSAYFPNLSFDEVDSFLLVAEQPLSGIAISGDAPSSKLLFTQAKQLPDFDSSALPNYTGEWTGTWKSTQTASKGGPAVLRIHTQEKDQFSGFLDVLNTDCGDVTDLAVSGTVIDDVFDFNVSFLCVALTVDLHFYNGVVTNSELSGQYDQSTNGEIVDTGTFLLSRQ